MDNTEEFRCISLCTGYAGIELGLRRVIPNLRTIAYVEREGFACSNLVAKIEEGKLDAAPIWTDIKTFDGRPFYNKVHLITGGYPCQPFSCAGKRKGTDDPRHLWPYIEGIIQSVRPVWCFFENVSGHLTIGFPEVYRSLRNLGYKIEAGLFTAAECGAPHKRERLFILALAQPERGRHIHGQPQEQPTEGRLNAQCESQPDSELANSTLTNSTRQRQLGNDISLPESKGISNTNSERLQEPRAQRSKKAQPAVISRWPARPGQQQYEWEEPRCTMANPTRTGTRHQSGKVDRGKRSSKIRQENGQACSIRPDAADKGQAQSSVGRAVNGPACRVDRLRLLGNGVVPQCAEKAFSELMGLFR